MSAVKMARPRVLRSKNDRPLTLDEIRGVAPAVFQTQAASHMSAQFAYVPTFTILEALLAQGFQCHEVAQSRPYKRDREPYMKHMLRMRFPSEGAPTIGGLAPELVLVNAHNGTSNYYLFGGIYRFICTNGMVVGDTFASMKVRHSGGELTKHRVLEGSYTIVNEQLPAVLGQVKSMQQRVLTLPERTELAGQALALRYPNTVPSFAANDLLRPRRTQDEADDLWTVFNVVQENVTQGGSSGRSVLFTQRTTMRAVERVDALVGLNRKLWDVAAGYLKAA
jgi:hypothetical protein